jgi:NAD(P)-dependent dehydrogenase (short-subunit alcohol dehydrogenase family)
MKEFKDKVALVTGGASGIGYALADRFASVGMKIVLADVEDAALDKAEQSLKDKGAPVLSVRTDVSNPGDVERLAERAYDHFGAVHVLCNNAGVGSGGLSWEQPLEDWEWVFGVNLWGVVHGLRTFVPRMIAQGTEGHVVNTASVAGLITTPYMSVYGATKHAVVAITESLRMELEMIGSSVSASVVCPGFVATNIGDSERNRPAEFRVSTTPKEADQQAVIRELARQQVAAGMKPSDVAEMVLEAIRDDRFYVITHPRFKKLIRMRMENIVDEKNPRFEPMP